MRIYEDIRAKQRLYSQYGGQCSFARAIVADGTIAMTLYRLQAALARWRLSWLAWFVHSANKALSGCVVGVHASFEEGFVLIHPIGVVINSRVRGGRNVWIESSVVIGENRGGFPTLGSDIFIGSGAKIIGAVHVADGARIGANAVVLHDVAAGATVVGVPAREIRRAAE